MYISDSDFDEYMEWRHKQAAEAAERERQRKVKQLQKEQHEDFLLNKRIDQELMSNGVSKGLTWIEYVRQTAAPGSLKDRYLQLQQQSGIKPGSISADKDLFMEGFNRT